MSRFGWRAPGALGQPVSCHRQRAEQCRRHCDRGTFACRNSKTRLHRISEKDSRSPGKLPSFLVDIIPILWTAFVDGLPVPLLPRAHIRVGHRHSPIAVRRRLPSHETTFERVRLSFWHVPPCPSRAPAQRFWLEADSLAPVAEWECCEPTGAAAGEHSRRGDKYFPALEVRMEERLAVLGHAQSEWSKMALLAVGAV